MSLATEVDLIRRVPVFGAIGAEKQKLLCFSSERLTFEPGQVMFREGDAADAAYVVIDGTVEITVDTPSGPLLVNTLGESDVVGETAIFGEGYAARKQRHTKDCEGDPHLCAPCPPCAGDFAAGLVATPGCFGTCPTWPLSRPTSWFTSRQRASSGST